MLPPEIVEKPDLSIDEKIGRLRNLDASLRSLYRALYRGETPWDELAEIETEIRSLEQMLPSANTVDRCRDRGDDAQRHAVDIDELLPGPPPPQGPDAAG